MIEDVFGTIHISEIIVIFILVFILLWCWSCIDERRKQKKINQDRSNEAIKYCDKFKKDTQRITQDCKNGKYDKNGRRDFKSYYEDLGDAADCLLSYVRSLHIGKRNDKDLSSRISTHLLISNEIRDTACDFVYQGAYDEYKDQRISDIVVELMKEPYK
jgi:hypothetical protein